MLMKFNRADSRGFQAVLFMAALGSGLMGCSASSNSGTGSHQELACGAASLQADPNPGALVTPAITGANVMPLTVDGSQCLSINDANSAVGPNSPCVSVTVCPPGASTSDPNCQVISGLLLDTGSVGLRVFKSVLNASLLDQLTPVVPTGGSGVLAECVTYADGSADWGPVANATVFMGGESGVNTPIQLIDGYYGGWGANGWSICNNYAGGSSNDVRLDLCPTNVPAHSPVFGTGLGYNGILGVGMYAQDCGTACSSSDPTVNPGMYYTCSGSLSSSTGCSANPIAQATSKQVQNPVHQLSQDNNGVVLTLPSVGPNGVSSASGYVIFGIGTQSNNTPANGVTALPLSPYTGEITASLNGGSDDTFIDSGSTFYNVPSGSSTSSLTDCTNYNPEYQYFYCPQNNSSSPVSLSFPLLGNGGSPSLPITIQIGNPIEIFSSPTNWVFSNIAIKFNLVGFSNNTVDLGLPFYLGRTIYQGFEGKSSSLASGTYWAF